MRAIHRFVGCALCIVGFGSAAATGLETQDLGNSTQTLVDGGCASSGGASGGDTSGIAPDGTPSSGSSSSSSSSRRGNSHSSGGAATPAPTQRHHLGWQSLLPGSIQ